MGRFVPISFVQLLTAVVFAFNLASPGLADQYKRAKFQKSGWSTKGGMTIRHQILAARAMGKFILYDNGSSKKVVLGTWRDEMTGLVYRAENPFRLLEIDHLIPLKWAWDHGAENWDYAKRNKFANDRRFLLITAKSVNGSKSEKGADLYLPINRDLACTYLVKFQEGVMEYDLKPTASESTLMNIYEKDVCRKDQYTAALGSDG